MSDDIKAGKYELVALFWERILSKPGEPFDFVRYHKGDTVELNVADARRLVKAGAVKVPTEDDDEDAEVPGARESVVPGAEPGELADPAAETKPVTADAILAEVGDDKDKAAAALEAEQAKPTPRTSLIAKLQKIAG